MRLRAERTSEVEALTAPLRRGLFQYQPLPRVVGAGDRAILPDTLKVMVCLLAFRENRRPDLTTVPPDGKFMAASDTIPTFITRADPPPHDVAYFNAHMGAMAEFFRIQSYGKLHIDWDIVSGPDEGLFLLPDLADYGPAEIDSLSGWTLELLENFVRTALDSIDAGLQALPDGPRFRDYDNVMIFHAGSDLQNDIFRDSPNDLPSFNIFFGDPLGPHPVDGGQTPLGSVLLLPETTIQDVEPAYPYLGALNAVTAHEFAHQLGLVDTYNTLWNWPSVGYWDLMGSGHQILFGLQREGDTEPLFVFGALPTSLSIWHRMQLGWVNESEGSLVRRGGGQSDEVLLAANLQTPGPKALRVDLSDREYFLMENRQEIHYELPEENFRGLKTDPETGVFQFMSITEDGETNSGEYDFFIPQSGLLVWHVDERNFEYLFYYNEINPDHDRHVRLIEADGADDLGNPYSWNWRGNDLDPFFTGNNVLWSGITTPSTRLRDKTASGFVMSELVTSEYLPETVVETHFDSVITFRIQQTGVPAGLPRDDAALLDPDYPYIDPPLPSLPATGTLLPYGSGEQLGYLLAFLDEQGQIGSHWVASDRDANDNGRMPPLQPLPTIGGFPLTAAHLPQGPAVAASWFTIVESQNLAGLVYRLHGFQDPSSEQPGSELFSPIDLPAPPASALAAAVQGSASYLAWLDADYVVNLFRPDEERASPLLRSRALAARLPDRPDREEVALSASDPVWLQGEAGLTLALALGDTLYLFDPDDLAAPPQRLATPDPGEEPVWLLLLDLDEDGVDSSDEIFWIDGTGRVAQLDGEALALRFAADLGDAGLSAAPVPGDLDGDGQVELFFAAGERVHRLTLDGIPYSNWPLRLEEMAILAESMRAETSLRVADMTGDGLAELVFFAQTGHLLVVDHAGQPQFGTPRSLAAASPQDFWVEAGRVRGISSDGAFIGFDGDPASAPAEWSLDGGGPDRRGAWRREHALRQVQGVPTDGWFLYPNPARDTARLHNAAVPAGTQVQVKIFDLEGQLRLSREASKVDDGPVFEMELDLRQLASAVYFCQVEVISGGERYQVLERLAVLR